MFGMTEVHDVLVGTVLNDDVVVLRPLTSSVFICYCCASQRADTGGGRGIMKRVLVVLSAACIGLLATACGGGSDSDKDNNGKDDCVEAVFGDIDNYLSDNPERSAGDEC
jgi:hypothetical protein